MGRSFFFFPPFAFGIFVKPAASQLPEVAFASGQSPFLDYSAPPSFTTYSPHWRIQAFFFSVIMGLFPFFPSKYVLPRTARCPPRLPNFDESPLYPGSNGISQKVPLFCGGTPSCGLASFFSFPSRPLSTTRSSQLPATHFDTVSPLEESLFFFPFSRTGVFLASDRSPDFPSSHSNARFFPLFFFFCSGMLLTFPPFFPGSKRFSSGPPSFFSAGNASPSPCCKPFFPRRPRTTPPFFPRTPF